jgi:hypothetical protein
MPASSLRKNLAGLSLVAAPLLLIAGDSLNGMPAFFTPRYILVKAGLGLFVGAALALMHLLRGRADRAGLVCGGMTIFGAVSGAALVTMAFTAWQLDANGMSPAVEASFRSSFIAAVWYPFPGILFPLGLVTLGITLFVTRAIPRAAAVMIALGGLFFPLGRIPDRQVFELISGGLLLAGMGPVGVRFLRASVAEWNALALAPLEDGARVAVPAIERAPEPVSQPTATAKSS